MNKSGPDSTETPTAQVGKSAGVVAAFGRNRRSVSKATQPKPSMEDKTQLSALSKSIEHLPEIDAAKVVELHHRIMAGEYQIDSKRLAEKMLDFENELEN